MISSDTHIIRQLVFDISCSGSTMDGVSLQQKMTSLCTDEIIPVLEKILNRNSHIKGHVYIDLLEIDLGIFQPDELEHELADVFKEKLEFLLTEPSLQKRLTHKEKEIQTTDDHIRYTDDVTSFGEAFIHFLQTGQLPWTFRLPAGKTLNQVLSEIMNGQDRDALLHKIRDSITQPTVVRRIILQIDESIVMGILNFVSPTNANHVKKLLTFFPNLDYTAFRQYILEAAFRRSTSENTIYAEGEIFALAFELLHIDPAALLPLKSDQIVEVARKHHVDIKPNELSKGHSIQDRTVVPQSSYSISPEDTPGFYIDNAGLILLHPFLPILFEGTGIVKDDKVVDPHRALLLLHYLCSGQKEAPEYDLTFAKIICGIPVHEPVPSIVSLHPQDIEEAEALLSSVIRHWSVLQNTSQDGLRGTFLLRHGKLSTAFDGGWLLQVERKSVDILLDSLPWGIGIVKLPWLPQLIHVEW